MNINNLMSELKMWFGPTDSADEQSHTSPVRQPIARNSLCYVVDDEPGIRQLLASMLEAMVVQVEGFGDVKSLLTGLDRFHPQLIFLDISLEGSDAVEALRILADHKYRGSIILMSGRHGQILDDINLIGERHGLKMLPSLAKPLDITSVRRVARAYFGDSRKPCEARVAIDEAIERGWMKVWYQPKIDLKRKILVGCEALSRIEHPDHGIMSPGTFLPNASFDSMTKLTEHVLLTVLRDCTKFKQVGIALQPAVNIPVDVLLKFPLARLVRENRPKDDAWRGLIVEVTEDQIVSDIALAQEIATQLKIYEIELSIDDFGAGYSSLERLKHLPFAELKLDMSLVKGCGSTTKSAGLCKAAIDLAHSFDAKAVAEGIEQIDDLKALHSFGCDLGQGFLLAPPMPIERFLPILKQRKPVHDNNGKSLNKIA